MTADAFTTLIDEVTRKSIILNVMSSVRKSIIGDGDENDPIKTARLNHFNTNDAAALEIELQKQLALLVESEEDLASLITKYIHLSGRTYPARNKKRVLSTHSGSLDLAYFFEYRISELAESKQLIKLINLFRIYKSKNSDEESLTFEEYLKNNTEVLTSAERNKLFQLLRFSKVYKPVSIDEKSLSSEEFKKNITEELTAYLLMRTVNEFLIKRDTDRAVETNTDTATNKLRFSDVAIDFIAESKKLKVINEKTVYYLKDRLEAINLFKSSAPVGCEITFVDEACNDAKITTENNELIYPGEIVFKNTANENQQDENLIKTQVMVEQYNKMQAMRRDLLDRQSGLQDHERMAQFGERCSKPETLSLLDQYASWNLKKVLYALVNLFRIGQFSWWAAQPSQKSVKKDGWELSKQMHDSETMALVDEPKSWFGIR